LLGPLFETGQRKGEEEHVLILATPRILPVQEAEHRTPTIPPVVEEKAPNAAADPPTDAEVLRALPRLPGSYPFCEVSRDDITIVKERLKDEHPVRLLDGIQVQQHCVRWRCTVFYVECIEGRYPFPFRRVAPRMEVVYVDRCSAEPFLGMDGLCY
jgi:hypothetical protein